MESGTTRMRPDERPQGEANGASSSPAFGGMLGLPPAEPVFDADYTPRVSLGIGWAALRELAVSIYSCRELIWRLFLRDLTARYRQSVLGCLWAIVPSLVTVATFGILNRSQVLSIGETNLPYPLFVMLGLTVWQTFADGISRMTASLVGAGSMISKINFPRESLVLAAMCEVLFDGLIRWCLVALMFVIYRVTPGWTAVLIPLVMVPLTLLTLGVGFLMAPLNAVIRDVANALTLFLTFAMLLTPVVYPPPSRWPSMLINYLNPVSPFVIAVRDLAIGQLPSNAWALLGASAFSAVLFFMSWRVFHLGMARIVERV